LRRWWCKEVPVASCSVFFCNLNIVTTWLELGREQISH
jgi:hypothetical protein